MSQLRAEDFLTHGHEVRVITATPAASSDLLPYAVLRNPSPAALFQSIGWSDVCFHNNLCVRFSRPLFFLKRPWVIAYQTWITQPDGSTGWSERVKRLLLRVVHSAWISRAIAGVLPVTSRITPNCYDNSTFDHASIDASARERAPIFVGRLVPDKGAEIVLQALALIGGLQRGENAHFKDRKDGIFL